MADPTHAERFPNTRILTKTKDRLDIVLDKTSSISDIISAIRKASKRLRRSEYMVYSGMVYPHSGVIYNRTIQSKDDFSLGFELELMLHRSHFRNLMTRKKAVSMFLNSNWFYCSDELSLVKDYALEICSIPLNSVVCRDPRLWAGFTSYISMVASSDVFKEAGLHFHLGLDYVAKSKGIHPLQAACEIVYIYKSFITFGDGKLLKTIFGRTYNRYCKSINRQDTFTFLREAFSTLRKKSTSNDLSEFYDGSPFSNHYSEVSVDSRYATIEFRLGKGTLNPARLGLIIDFLYVLMTFVKKNDISREENTLDATKLLISQVLDGTVLGPEDKEVNPILKTLLAKYSKPGITKTDCAEIKTWLDIELSAKPTCESINQHYFE